MAQAFSSIYQKSFCGVMLLRGLGGTVVLKNDYSGKLIYVLLRYIIP